MSNCSQPLSNRSKAVQTQKIEGKVAAERQIDCGIGVKMWGTIFIQDDIFNPVQAILNLPMCPNQLSKGGGAGAERTDKPTTLMIGFARTSADLLNADSAANARPLWIELIAAGINPNHSCDCAMATDLVTNPSLLGGGIKSHPQQS